MDSLSELLSERSQNQIHIGEYLKLLFLNKPVGVFWKDSDLVLQGGNSFLSQVTGLKGSDDIIGKSDFDLCWTESQTIGFRHDDQDVLTQVTLSLVLLKSNIEVMEKVILYVRLKCLYTTSLAE